MLTFPVLNRLRSSRFINSEKQIVINSEVDFGALKAAAVSNSKIELNRDDCNLLVHC